MTCEKEDTVTSFGARSSIFFFFQQIMNFFFVLSFNPMMMTSLTTFAEYNLVEIHKKKKFLLKIFTHKTKSFSTNPLSMARVKKKESGKTFDSTFYQNECLSRGKHFFSLNLSEIISITE